MKTILFTQLGETLDKLFLQTVELIAAFRQVARIELIFQPDPLEKRGFVQRGWRISVIFQQFGFTGSIPRQIET